MGGNTGTTSSYCLPDTLNDRTKLYNFNIISFSASNDAKMETNGELETGQTELIILMTPDTDTLFRVN